MVYTIGESGPAAYEWASLSCTGYPDTTQAAPTLTLAPGDNVTCTLNNDDILVPVSVEKADGVVQQLADGTWSIAYEVVVTNTSADAADQLLADRHARVRLELHDPLPGMAG